MRSMLWLGILVLGLGAGCARDPDASGDAPESNLSMEDAGPDAAVEAEPVGGSGNDVGAGGESSGGGAGTGTDGTMGPSAAKDAGVGPSMPSGGGSGSGGFPGPGSDGGFDPCDIQDLPNIPGLPLPEGGIMIPGCP